MEPQTTPPQEPGNPTVAEHVSGAHELLESLRQRIGEHPELGQAITHLEMALSILTVKTAGLL